jgi:ATP-dependent DNA helicase RecQ
MIQDIESPQQKQIESHKLDAMVGFAEAITCRRRVLLGYFGEDLGRDCGNCDVCLKPRQTYDATEDAYQALMCVFQLQQKFGMMHVIDVLRGADTQRIRQFSHSQVEMYGKGSSQSLDHWSSVFRQLIHLGYLRQDIANFSALKLTPLTKPIVRREATLALATPVARLPKRGRQRSERRAGIFAGVTDEPLFQALRTVRKRLADAAEVPPFVIFSDVTLVEMSKAKPTTMAQLLDITGIGKHKQERYGREFLDAIQAHLGTTVPA